MSRLRRENRTLKQEKEVLRKTRKTFAKPSLPVRTGCEVNQVFLPDLSVRPLSPTAFSEAPAIVWASLRPVRHPLPEIEPFPEPLLVALGPAKKGH